MIPEHLLLCSWRVWGCGSHCSILKNDDFTLPASVQHILKPKTLNPENRVFIALVEVELSEARMTPDRAAADTLSVSLYVSLSLFISFSPSLSLSLSLSISLSNTHDRPVGGHPVCQPASLSCSLSYTHTHTHAHTHREFVALVEFELSEARMTPELKIWDYQPLLYPPPPKQNPNLYSKA